MLPMTMKKTTKRKEQMESMMKMTRRTKKEPMMRRGPLIKRVPKKGSQKPHPENYGHKQ